MSVTSARFIFVWLIVSAFFWFLPAGRSRRLAFGVLTVAFAVTFIPNVPTVAALLVFLVSGYAVATLLRARPSKFIFMASIALMVAVFIVLKRYDGLQFILPANLLNLPIAILGLSYILFRQIHFMTDAMQGQIESCSIGSYLMYQLNPLTILAGPIQRYQDFHGFWKNQEPLVQDQHDLMATYQRMFWGLIKVAVIAPLFLTLWTNATSAYSESLSRQSLMPRMLSLFYAYPVFIYFNFSGYCDIVIAFGRLIGLPVPENFDRPYISRNMIDFWTRQHRTLSFWIRDYLFTPMYMGCTERWPAYATWFVFLCYFVAFFLAGIWHGSTVYFLIFGLLQGIGVSATKIWEQTLIWRCGRDGWKRYLRSPTIRIAAIVITLNFVCFAHIFFTPDPPQVLHGLGECWKSLLAKV
jgi:alginate O-acetyltransferase complex protein AlgI